MIVACGAHTMTINDFTYGFVYFVLFCSGVWVRLLFLSQYLINTTNLLLAVFILFHSLMPYLFAKHNRCIFWMSLYSSYCQKTQRNHQRQKLLTFFGTLRSIFLILCEWGTELCLITFVVVLLHTQLLCALRVCREALYYHNHHEMTVFNNNKNNRLIRWERA